MVNRLLFFRKKLLFVIRIYNKKIEFSTQKWYIKTVEIMRRGNFDEPKKKKKTRRNKRATIRVKG
ncbi:hypothetical protein EfmAA94_32860 (plasmid) [Enterococcus faecium]|nr:hypothetical protein EfmJHP80_30020 [Enterococcus faecium]BDP68621.1 hypothetical protein EfmAA55_30500 [Enterococcus faecium]BDP72113.1 hypothetical protein EfmAA94_32860 [Enterococcus faecium]BDP75609.1 hypothetical protein EfmAA96_33940 [Enterococcus faecium]